MEQGTVPRSALGSETGDGSSVRFRACHHETYSEPSVRRKLKRGTVPLFHPWFTLERGTVPLFPLVSPRKKTVAGKKKTVAGKKKMFDKENVFHYNYFSSDIINAMTALCLSEVHFREPAVGVSRCGTDCAVSCLSRFPEAFWCVRGSVRPT